MADVMEKLNQEELEHLAPLWNYLQQAEVYVAFYQKMADLLTKEMGEYVNETVKPRLKIPEDVTPFVNPGNGVVSYDRGVDKK